MHFKFVIGCNFFYFKPLLYYIRKKISFALHYENPSLFWVREHSIASAGKSKSLSCRTGAKKVGFQIRLVLAAHANQQRQLYVHGTY